ncbi:LpxI family protein [Yoonia sp. MH D7]
MLALIAGTGALPAAIVAARPDALVCAMAGFLPEVPTKVTFRIEQLGSFISQLKGLGVTQVCFAGAVKRPVVDPYAIDAATKPLVPLIAGAIAQGDDGALRAVLGIFENDGFEIVAAHALVPQLLPAAGVPTRRRPDAKMMAEAVLGERVLVKLGARDLGQACVISGDQVVAQEDDAGTDALIAAVRVTGGVLVKGPKPDQDRRADLPVIGIATARGIVDAGLDGIVIEAGGVMVLDMTAVISELDAHDKVLWVRPTTER